MTKRSIRRRQSRQKQSQKGLGWKAYGLIIGALIIVLSSLIFLNQEDDPSLFSGEVSLDKSKGTEDAPVVVVEYGDFQ